MTDTQTKQIIHDFIEEVWNNQKLDRIPQFLHSGYQDHSFPSGFPDNQEGLTKWINATGQAFRHHTFIEEHITEDEKSVIKIKMTLIHIGGWRGIPATGKTVTAKGFRLYRLHEGKIIEHWGLIDGNAIENQLKENTHGCKIAE